MAKDVELKAIRIEHEKLLALQWNELILVRVIVLKCIESMNGKPRASMDMVKKPGS